MPALTITASAIISGTGATKQAGIAGATLTAGLPVYKDSADSDKLKAADCDASSAAATVVGITLHAALSGQPITYQTSGTLAFGAILTVGKIYVAGATAGEINPSADLTTGWRTSILGVATSTSNLAMNIYNSDTAN